MRVLICGGRDFDDYAYLAEVLDYQLADWLPADNTDTLIIIHGAARGADTLAGFFARHNNIEQDIYPADWLNEGKKAGYIRNSRMLKEGKPALVIAFPGGKGTAMMVDLARKAGVEVKEIKYHGNKEDSKESS